MIMGTFKKLTEAQLDFCYGRICFPDYSLRRKLAALNHANLEKAKERFFEKGKEIEIIKRDDIELNKIIFVLPTYSISQT